ncbi:hypothetical protein [Methylobacterium sp. 1973]|uniref:hypothetical protein n=1 Tax=Methylobacterium sp. 1973 TaxID=3156421 RepID=UPI0033975377
MKAAPPPIALSDLDRDELLQLLQARPVYCLRPADLWSARYDVLERRAKVASERREAAGDAYYPLMRAMDPSTMSQRAWSKLQADREAARKAYEVAQRAYRRAAGARDRAFDALMASYGHRREPA